MGMFATITVDGCDVDSYKGRNTYTLVYHRNKDGKFPTLNCEYCYELGYGTVKLMMNTITDRGYKQQICIDDGSAHNSGSIKDGYYNSSVEPVDLNRLSGRRATRIKAIVWLSCAEEPPTILNNDDTCIFCDDDDCTCHCDCCEPNNDRCTICHGCSSCHSDPCDDKIDDDDGLGMQIYGKSDK